MVFFMCNDTHIKQSNEADFIKSNYSDLCMNTITVNK